MVPHRSRQLAGLAIALLSACLTAWNWYSALARGLFYLKASMVFPALLVLGIGIILFPGYREERLARGEDISHLQGWRLITVRWWVVILAALALAAANYLLLHSL